MASATTNGKNFLPRVAALLDVAQISDVIAIESADTFVRPVYAGNAIATVKSSDTIKVLTVRSAAFDAVDTGNNAAIENISLAKDAGVSSFVSEELTKSERPELTAAKVIISGGRGMQNGENFALLNGIADKAERRYWSIPRCSRRWFCAKRYAGWSDRKNCCAGSLYLQ